MNHYEWGPVSILVVFSGVIWILSLLPESIQHFIAIASLLTIIALLIICDVFAKKSTHPKREYRETWKDLLMHILDFPGYVIIVVFTTTLLSLIGWFYGSIFEFLLRLFTK
jgi:hypothetical protein